MSWLKRFKKDKSRDETEDPAKATEDSPAEDQSLDDPLPDPPTEAGEETRQGLLARFKERLSKTRTALSTRLDSLLAGKTRIDEETLEGLEEILITSDLGVGTAAALLEKLRVRTKKERLTEPEALKSALKDCFLELAAVEAEEPAKPTSGPEVILVVGVNGVGKTTTIGKLAHRYIAGGRKVLLAAGDTFRAAAGEQLTIWAERVGAEIVCHRPGADPSAVVFDALEAAQAREIDVVLVDTAGRLHTKVNLMKELKKIRRVMAGKIPDAPHQTLLVLDATTGQNALSQASLFNEATPLTGFILTKLDGTAKGGIAIAVAHQMNRPVLYVGLGEKMGDLKPFDPEAFVEAIL